MQIIQNRRTFLAGAAAAGAASLVGADTGLGRDAARDTDRALRGFPGGGCIAPQYIAEGLLRGEGFTDFRYVPAGKEATAAALIAKDQADFGLDFASALVVAVDTGVRLKGLCGVHVGCWELFAHEGINSVPDLKGKSVGIGPHWDQTPICT